MQWWVHGHCNHKNLSQKETRSDQRLHVLGNTHDHIQSNISIWQGEQSCFTGNFWWVMGESTVRAMATCFGSLGYTCLQLKLEKVSQWFSETNSVSMSAAASPNFTEHYKIQPHSIRTHGVNLLTTHSISLYHKKSYSNTHDTALW